MATKKNICIIGAGIGGLISGAILSGKGYKVKIFEKKNLSGGRALSMDMSSLNYKKYLDILKDFNMHVPFSEPPLEKIFKEKKLDGINLDLGYHVIGGGILDKISEILSIPIKDIEILESRLYEQKNDHFGYFVTNFEKIKMIPNILRVLLASEKTMKEMDKASITETIKKYAKGKTKIVLEVNSRLFTTVNNLDIISTGEVFRTQKDMRLKGVRYPKGGLSYIIKKLVKYIENHEGKIFLNKPVDRIIIENGEAIGVIANNKKYYCDKVIANVLVQNLFDIADKKHLPKEYVNSLKSSYGTGSLCAYYSLKDIKSDLIGKTFVFIERNVGIEGNDAVGMIDFMTASPKAGLSKNDHIVQSYLICNPKEAKNKKILKKLRKILDKNLERIIPNYKNDLKWCFYPAIWHLDGIAKTIDNKKADIKTPIKNLFLVGDCTKAPGIGINCAINSAKILCNEII